MLMEKTANSDISQMRIPLAQSLIFALFSPVSTSWLAVFDGAKNPESENCPKSLEWSQGMVTVLEADRPKWDREIIDETDREQQMGQNAKVNGDLPCH